MANYTYVVVDSSGKERRGSLDADSRNRAAALLKKEGQILVSLNEAGVLSKNLEFSFLQRKPSARDLAVFCRQFVSIVSAGVQVTSALEMLAEQTDNKMLAAAVEEGLHHLAPMGRYVIIGTNTFAAQATLSPGYITRKSLTVTGVARYLPEYLHKSLVFLDKFQHKYPFDDFSSMTFDLNDLEKGLEMVADRKVIRAVVESGDESNA